MKATGVVRKIDDLGRIVIPKEIRNVQGWKHNTPIEMFMDDKGMVIREYKPASDEKQEILEELITARNNTENEAAREIFERAIKYVKEN
jgi:AbrB family looped-hinge helix DNA binding protein